MPTPEPSISAMSQHLGVSRASVRKALLQGMPRDLEGATAWRDANVDPERSKRAKDAPAGSAATRTSTLVASRTRKIDAETRLAELQLQLLQGTLVSREIVRAEIGRRLANLRSSLLQIPARLGPVVAGEPDPTKAERVIEDALFEVLQGFVETLHA